MNLLKVANYIVMKYGLDAKRLEDSIREDISMLWKYANDPKQYNILGVCAEVNPKNPTTPHETKAQEGAKFCQKLLSIINYLQVHRYDISLPMLQKALHEISNLIDSNKTVRISEKGKISEKGEKQDVQFPHVSELIFQIMPHGTVSDRARRDQQYSKAKTGLSRILSLALTMQQNLRQLELAAPERFVEEDSEEDIGELPGRFAPQRAVLSIYDIISFIREHGDEYGLSSIEDWETVFRDDPQLKEDMTTIINAVNRGHIPLGSADMKMEIARILRNHEQRKKTNAKFFEEEALPPANIPASESAPLGIYLGKNPPLNVKIGPISKYKPEQLSEIKNLSSLKE